MTARPPPSLPAPGSTPGAADEGAAGGTVPAYVVKAGIPDPGADSFVFTAAKTMYGGRRITVGDDLFVFASENAGGTGLVALAVVTAAEAVPRRPGPERQTPRITLVARRLAPARLPLGRRELKAFRDWDDGQPETELNFKLYRQATDKVVGVSPGAAAFLRRCL